MTLQTLLRTRRSIRVYEDKPIEPEKLEQILEAGLLAASGRGKRPCRFVLVTDREMLSALSKSRVGSAEMLTGANAAIVVVADAELSDTWVEDSSIAMANMMLMATELGIGSCWIQGRGRGAESGESTEEYVRRLLNFAAPYRLEAILSLGYPGEHKEPREVTDEMREKIRRERF